MRIITPFSLISLYILKCFTYRILSEHNHSKMQNHDPKTEHEAYEPTLWRSLSACSETCRGLPITAAIIEKFSSKWELIATQGFFAFFDSLICTETHIKSLEKCIKGKAVILGLKHHLLIKNRELLEISDQAWISFEYFFISMIVR